MAPRAQFRVFYAAIARCLESSVEHASVGHFDTSASDSHDDGV